MKIDPVSIVGLQPAPEARNDSIGRQFEAMIYRMLLQQVDLTAGINSGTQAYSGIYREMLTDFLSQEMAKQQSSYGAMLLNATELKREGIE